VIVFWVESFTWDNLGASKLNLMYVMGKPMGSIMAGRRGRRIGDREE